MIWTKPPGNNVQHVNLQGCIHSIKLVTILVTYPTHVHVHLPLKCIKCIGKYTSPMDPMGTSSWSTSHFLRLWGHCEPSRGLALCAAADAADFCLGLSFATDRSQVLEVKSFCWGVDWKKDEKGTYFCSWRVCRCVLQGLAGFLRDSCSPIGFDPYMKGVKTSFFMVLGSKGT